MIHGILFSLYGNCRDCRDKIRALGDILQRAVTSAVVNSTKYVNRRIKKEKRRAKRLMHNKKMSSERVKLQKGGGLGLEKTRKNHMPIVYQYHQ